MIFNEGRPFRSMRLAPHIALVLQHPVHEAQALGEDTEHLRALEGLLLREGVALEAPGDLRDTAAVGACRHALVLEGLEKPRRLHEAPSISEPEALDELIKEAHLA